ncbi:unnamed protein product [Camellia sinensis]
MASPTIQEYCAEQHRIREHEDEDEDEEEEELFEINLEVVNNFPPPQYSESYFTSSTNNALLANCLLPIADLAGAIPMVSKASYEFSFPAMLPSGFVILAESVPGGKGELLGFPSLGLVNVLFGSL